VQVHCWTKKKGWEWQREEFADLADEIFIEALGSKVALAKIYDGLFSNESSSDCK